VVLSREATGQMTEEELISRCRAGELEAFAVIYDRYGTQVYRYAYHLLGHREDADDIKQETFVRAHQAIGKFRCEASLRTWLLRICANLCRDRIKSWERRKIAYNSELPEPLWNSSAHEDSSPYAVMERAETNALILRALHGLPAGHREVIILHDVEEMKYEEIAGILGCSHASAKLRVFRARRKLKERVIALLEVRE